MTFSCLRTLLLLEDGSCWQGVRTRYCWQAAGFSRRAETTSAANTDRQTNSLDLTVCIQKRVILRTISTNKIKKYFSGCYHRSLNLHQSTLNNKIRLKSSSQLVILIDVIVCIYVVPTQKLQLKTLIRLANVMGVVNDNKYLPYLNEKNNVFLL